VIQLKVVYLDGDGRQQGLRGVTVTGLRDGKMFIREWYVCMKHKLFLLEAPQKFVCTEFVRMAYLQMG
jgi:hypothetical protein